MASDFQAVAAPLRQRLLRAATSRCFASPRRGGNRRRVGRSALCIALYSHHSPTLRIDDHRSRFPYWRDPRPPQEAGAVSNAVGRYETQTRTLVDDGWDDGWRDTDLAPPPLRTEVIYDALRSAIVRNKSPDISFDQSINPCCGCEHGCIYCFARPDARLSWHVAGHRFQVRPFAKPNAAELLAKELSAPGYVPKVIVKGSNTDPYQPLEKKMRITPRSIPEVLKSLNHPVARYRDEVSADHARHRYPV